MAGSEYQNFQALTPGQSIARNQFSGAKGTLHEESGPLELSPRMTDLTSRAVPKHPSPFCYLRSSPAVQLLGSQAVSKLLEY